MPDVQDIVAEVLRDDEYVLGTFGDTGPQGEKGDQGEEGPQGPAGPSNVLSIGTVVRGDDAAASITGTSPNQILNLTLPKGDQGIQGPEGPTGFAPIANVTKSGDTVTISITDKNGTTTESLITSYQEPLLSCKWSDHLLNDISWLRADTFSWQSGETYLSVYNHLLEDIGVSRYFIPNDGFDTKFYRKSESDTTMFAWSAVGATLYTENEFPNIGDNFYYQGAIAGTVGSTGVEWLSYIKTLLGGDKHYPRKSSADSSGMYAWEVNASTVYYTTSPTPQVGDNVYLSGNVLTTVSEFVGVTSQTETIGSYTVTYYQANDGHKIVLADQETTVSNIYAESGIAWYYVLDTVNTRFKLPRTKWNFVGLRDTVGKYIPESLPDGSLTLQMYAENGATDNHIADGGNTTGSIVSIKLSDFNSVFQENSPVQQRATQMYLYFYVGNFSQSATEQTAGLNSELFNGKVDLRLSNVDNADNAASNALNAVGIRTVVETYHNGTDWYRVWSDGWCEQGGRVLSSASASEHIITFLKPYQDINYTITTATGDLSGGNYQYKSGFNWEWVTVRSLTPVSFSVYAGLYACSSWSWKVEGYIS